jgi:hypothetical protein
MMILTPPPLFPSPIFELVGDRYILPSTMADPLPLHPSQLPACASAASPSIYASCTLWCRFHLSERRHAVTHLFGPPIPVFTGRKREGKGERKGREEREATRTQRAAREKGVLETTGGCVSNMITERSERRKGRRAGAGRARPGRGEAREAREKWREYERAPRFTLANARVRWEKSRERN